jgi:anti-sigma regulatory factor (Ser/Thr protein kinase)
MNFLRIGKPQKMGIQVSDQKLQIKQRESSSTDADSTQATHQIKPFKTTEFSEKWIHGIYFANQLSHTVREKKSIDRPLQNTVNWLCSALRVDQCKLFRHKDGYFQSSYTSESPKAEEVEVTDELFNDLYQFYADDLPPEQVPILTLFHQHQLSETLQQWFQIHSISTAMMLPLVCQGELLGAISFFSERSYQWSDDELLLAEMLANQCAIAIYHAQLNDVGKAKVSATETLLPTKPDFLTDQCSLYLAEISHELRAPLTAILGFSHVLNQQFYGKLNERQLHYIDGINDSGKHLLALVNNILDLAKVEAKRTEIELSEINVFDLCRSCFHLIQEQVQEKGLSLICQIAPDIHHCLGDARRVKQILLNLLSNAVKFTSTGSISLQVERQPQKISFIVSDTGIGIAPEQLPLLFQPFQQLHQELEREAIGTGLGLYLSRRLAQLHGGDITVKSSIDHGSEFTFFLPMAKL